MCVVRVPHHARFDEFLNSLCSHIRVFIVSLQYAQESADSIPRKVTVLENQLTFEVVILYRLHRYRNSHGIVCSRDVRIYSDS